MRPFDDRTKSLLINQFCKTVSRLGASQCSEMEIALVRCKAGWLLTNDVTGQSVGTLGAWVPDDGNMEAEVEPVKICKKIKLPNLDEADGDEIDALLMITSELLISLGGYVKASKLNFALSAEERKARAKKAVQTRWENYRKQHDQ